MFERFTDEGRRTIVLAQEEARVLRHDHIGTEHLLLGLLQTADGLAVATMRSVGVSTDEARKQVVRIVGEGTGDQEPDDDRPFTPRAKKVLELSLREAMHVGHSYIGTEHILLALLREGGGAAAEALLRLGVDLSGVHAQVQTELQMGGGDRPSRSRAPWIRRDAPPEPTQETPADLHAQQVSPLERLDDTAWDAMIAARGVARRRGATQIGGIDLLVGLASVEGVGADALRAAGLDLDVLDTAVTAASEGADEAPSALLFEHEVRFALARGVEESVKMYHRAATTGHILFGLLFRPDAELSILLDGLGVTVSALQAELRPRLRDA